MNQVITNPNYHPRLEASIKRVGKFLTFYKTPSQFYDPETGVPKEVEVKAWIKLMAETVNSRIDGHLEGESFDARLREIISNVAITYKGREWPQPHHLETAANTIAKLHNTIGPDASKHPDSGMFGSFGSDKDLAHWAGKMKNADSVPDLYLYPPHSTKLISQHGVPEKTIEAYQMGFYMMHVKTYGPIEGKEKYESFVAWRKQMMPGEDEVNEKRTHSSDVIRQAVAGFNPTRAF